MSFGVHRYWKNAFVSELGNLCPSNFYTHHDAPPPKQVLDVAGGTGDISFRIL
jgi:ubiquinone/menaquinone biosynthesis C-methylase UbiE